MANSQPSKADSSHNMMKLFSLPARRCCSRDGLERPGTRPAIILLTLCVLAGALASAASSPAAATELLFQAQQTGWYVNDDPIFHGEGKWFRGAPVSSGDGYGDAKYGDSNYAYATETDYVNSSGARVVWEMGTRVGGQEIQVFIPIRSERWPAEVQYRVIKRTGADSHTLMISDRVRHTGGPRWHSLTGWETLSDGRTYWDTDGHPIEIEVLYDEAERPRLTSGVYADAVRMRCITRCGPEVVQPLVPSGVRFDPGPTWNPVSGATYYVVEASDSDGDTVYAGRMSCCGENLHFPTQAARFRVSAGNSAGESNWSDWVQVPAPATGVQTDWYVNDEPFLWGPEESWFEGSAGYGYGSNDYRYATAIRSSASAQHWVHWYMGDRVGRQRIDVYVPHRHATANVKYEITRNYGNTSLASIDVNIDQDNASGWTTLGTWDFDGADVVVILTDNEASPPGSLIGVDAMRMRCVSRCNSTPDVPTGVRYSSGWATWNATPDATAYDIEMSNGSSDILEAGLDCCRHRVRSDTTYFRIRANNSAGYGNWSGWFEGPVRVPDVPSNTRFRSGHASWDAVSDATLYDVGLWDGSTETVVDDVACCSLQIDDDSITHFHVRSVNPAGESGWSDYVQIRERPQVPGMVAGYGIFVGQFGPELFWQATQGATSYDIDARETGRDVADYRRGITCPSPEPGSRCGYLYREDRLTTQAFRQGTAFRIRAVNDTGTGPWSSWVTAVVDEAPGRITGVEYRSGRVYWDPLAGATSYEVNAKWRSGGKGRSGIRCSSQCSYSLQRRQDSSVMVRVRAENHAGRGPWSAWIKIPPIVPRLRGEPTIWGFDIHDHFLHFGANDVTVKWSSVSNATSYKVETRYRSLHGSIPKFSGSPKQITDSILTWINRLSECSSVGNRTPCYSIDSRGSATVRGKTEYRKPNVADNDEDRDSILEFRVTAYSDAGDDAPSKWTPLRDQRIRSEVDKPGCAVLKGIEFGSKAYDVISILAALYSGGASAAILQGLKIAAYPNVTAGAKMLLDCYSDPVDALKDIHPLIGKYLEIIGLDKIVSCVTAGNSFIAETDPTFGDSEADSAWITALTNRVSDRC